MHRCEQSVTFTASIGILARKQPIITALKIGSVFLFVVLKRKTSTMSPFQREETLHLQVLTEQQSPDYSIVAVYHMS